MPTGSASSGFRFAGIEKPAAIIEPKALDSMILPRPLSISQNFMKTASRSVDTGISSP